MENKLEDVSRVALLHCEHLSVEGGRILPVFDNYYLIQQRNYSSGQCPSEGLTCIFISVGPSEETSRLHVGLDP